MSLACSARSFSSCKSILETSAARCANGMPSPSGNVVVATAVRMDSINCSPKIAASAWSIALGGCGIQPGGIVGKTNPLGTQVIDREVHAGHLFHTYYKAVGLDPHKN